MKGKTKQMVSWLEVVLTIKIPVKGKARTGVDQNLKVLIRKILNVTIVTRRVITKVSALL